jgi:hypothetical protein
LLLPQAWLRQHYLQRALRGYPLYDPPHKVEERLLSREQANENFDYFMRVRQQRAAFFETWLRRYFWVTLTPDEKGVRALNRWGSRYAGLLLYHEGPGVKPRISYFTYDPPWTGTYVRSNVLFDMGISYGEIIIACCPKLHWDVDPISAFLPRTARVLKRSSGMGFQRPTLAGFDDPGADWDALGVVYRFAWQIAHNAITFEDVWALYGSHREDRQLILEHLLNNFRALRERYPATTDPNHPLNRMSQEEYLRLVDSEADEEGDGDE